MGQVIKFPGPATVESVLDSALEHRARIKSLVLSIQWDDDTFDTYHSEARVSILSMHVMCLIGWMIAETKGEPSA